MKDKVKKYIYENNLLNKGERVLVALSGGPDSVCLLHILYSLKEELQIDLGAMHINHMLRGEEAKEDSIYTKNLCDKLGIKYYVREINIEKIAKERGISSETCGREERYKAFAEVCNLDGFQKTAVAHNANDQAETVLMRMMRGTGLEGLTGIKAEREGGIIRPILCLNRDEIERYCEEKGLNPRIDKSNYERVYNRNKVRLDILPYMRENFNEDIINALNRMAMLLQKDNEFIDEYCRRKYDEYCIFNKDSITINKNLFIKEKEAIFTRIIKMAFKNIGESYQNFEMKHIYEIANLIDKNTGKQVHLTNNIIAENLYGDILLKKKVSEIKEEYEVRVEKGNIPTSVEFGQYKVFFEIINKKNNIEFSNNYLIKCFDYDKIEESIFIRNRKSGDKMVPLGMKGSKKIKDILMDLKVPRQQRDYIPVVCFDDKISWLVGLRTSQEFKITKDTKIILKIIFVEGE